MFRLLFFLSSTTVLDSLCISWRFAFGFRRHAQAYTLARMDSLSSLSLTFPPRTLIFLSGTSLLAFRPKRRISPRPERKNKIERWFVYPSLRAGGLSRQFSCVCARLFTFFFLFFSVSLSAHFQCFLRRLLNRSRDRRCCLEGGLPSALFRCASWVINAEFRGGGK